MLHHGSTCQFDRYFRDATKYLTETTESDVVDLSHLDKHGIRHFANRIRSHLNTAKSTKAGLSAEAQLLVALRYYATGNSLVSLKKLQT